MTSNILIPRPGSSPTPTPQPIPGPHQQSFTSTFGPLLPPAQYLHTPNGKAAYYSLPPTVQTPNPHNVLVIHGIQTPSLGMLPLAQTLHASHPHAHFVLLDLWGHGLSDTPVLPHTPDLFHALVDALLDYLQWSSVHVLGFSFGAVIAVGYVVLRPRRVESLVLVAPAGLIRSKAFGLEGEMFLRYDADEDKAREWVVRFLEGGELVVPRDWKERVSRGEVVPEKLREWQMYEHPGHMASVVAAFRDGGALDSHDVFARAAGMGKRSLVVLGEKDDLSTEEELRHLGFGNVFVVPRAGHGVVRDNVPEVATRISDFWENWV